MEPQIQANPIPRSRFFSEDLPASDRFDAWSDSVALLARPYLAPGVKPEECSFTMDAVLFGETFLTDSSITGVGGYRNPGSSPLHDAQEIVIVEYFWRGGGAACVGDQTWKINEGDIAVLDTTRGINISTDVDVSALTWAIPRRKLLDALGKGGDPYPRVISGNSLAGEVLWSAMNLAFTNLSRQSHADARSAAELLIGALAGMMRGTNQQQEDPAADHATLRTICTYIERNAADPELSPEQLCKRFGLSRARLYRLFAPLDGVTHYIRNVRLERCYAVLRSTSKKTKISDIAMECGFGNISHFNRLFRDTYGAAPGDVRAQASDASNLPVRHRGSPRIHIPEYQEWLAQL